MMVCFVEWISGSHMEYAKNSVCVTGCMPCCDAGLGILCK